MNFKKIGKIWKELDQTQRMRPTGTFFDYPFRSYISLKMACLKMKCKKHSGLFIIYVLIPCFQTAVTSKRMVAKGPGWSHFLHLIELIPDLTYSFKFHSQGALQKKLF
jgi:hypothetical protein